VAQLFSTPSREPEYHTKYKHNLATPTCNLGASAIQPKDLILIKMNTLSSTVHTEVWEGWVRSVTCMGKTLIHIWTAGLQNNSPLKKV
jgi:hypothetical protein